VCWGGAILTPTELVLTFGVIFISVPLFAKIDQL